MQTKMYRVRSAALEPGKKEFVDLDLEFEGARAFVIWDSILLGKCQVKVRMEIDPQLLLRDAGEGWDFLYQGSLVLPQPRNN